MDDDDERLVQIQRLKAALHYTVGRICEKTVSDAREQELESEHDEKSLEVSFSKQFIAAVSEAAYCYTQTISRDLELFARHAKRTTIGVDDVLLLARKSKLLTEHLRACAEKLTTAQKEKQQNVKRRERKKKTMAETERDIDTVVQEGTEHSLDCMTEESTM